MKTIKELAYFVENNDVWIIPPGTAQWQETGCYTAYKNFKNPTGCCMAEDKNPITAIVKLYKELVKVSNEGKPK